MVIFMSTKHSSGQSIIWNWVIEALASFEQVDIYTLADIVKEAPISNDLGNDAREMVYLRILESLFIRGNENTVETVSAQNVKIHFDPSERCEDVFWKIISDLGTTSETLTRSQRQKWDVHSFIMHKRSSLLTPHLKKLKEAILEGSHPPLVALKERSKLGVIKALETLDTQATVAKDDLASLPLRNENNRGSPELSGREDCDKSTKPPVGASNENTLMDHERAISKELEQSCDNGNSNHDQLQPMGNDVNFCQDTCGEEQYRRLSVDSMENLEFVVRFENRKNNSQANASAGAPANEVENPLEHDRQLEAGSSSDKSDDERIDITAEKAAFLSSQQTLSGDIMSIVEWSELNLCMKCNEGGDLLVCSSDACLLRVHESCLGSGAKFDENAKFFCPFCVYSRAIPAYLEAKRKISLARKDLQVFLSSGVKFRQKMPPTKQSRSGKNPVPAESSGLRVDTEVARGDNGVCLGEQSLREEVEEVGQNPVPVEPSGLRIDTGVPCGDKSGCLGKQSLREAEAVRQNPVPADPSGLHIDTEVPCGDKSACLGKQSLREAEEVRQNPVSAGPSGLHIDTEVPCGDNVCLGKRSLREAEEVGQKVGKRPSADAASSSGLKSQSLGGNRSCLGTGEHESPEKPVDRPKRKCREEENPLGVECSDLKRLRKKGKPVYRSAAVPSLRRKTLPWTKDEEEVMKEGVKRFSSSNKRGMPWTEILEFGRKRGVFDGRNPIDLKDKWRNICKANH